MKQLTDSAQLSRLVLKGFKSITDCHLELGSLNILIGTKSSLGELWKKNIFGGRPAR